MNRNSGGFFASQSFKAITHGPLAYPQIMPPHSIDFFPLSAARISLFYPTRFFTPRRSVQNDKNIHDFLTATSCEKFLMGILLTSNFEPFKAGF
jgi:hypothetical protein